MQAQKLTVQTRSRTGKEAARKLRAQGRIPAVLYGPKTEPVKLVVDPREFYHRLDPERKRNTIFELEVEGLQSNGPIFAIVKDYAVDTIRDTLLHLDFYRVHEGEPVEVVVPIVFTGKSKGEQMGGRPHAVLREVPVRCAPERIPARIEHDVTEVGIGDIVHVKDVDPGEGVEILLPPEQTLYSVAAGRGEVVEAQEGEGAEEGAEEAKSEASSSSEGK